MTDDDLEKEEFLEYARFGELENFQEALTKGFDVDCKGKGGVTGLVLSPKQNEVKQVTASHTASIAFLLVLSIVSTMIGSAKFCFESLIHQ